MAEVKKMGLNELLQIEDLRIPNYQRPYKWNVNNIRDLLYDISNAIDEYKRYKDGFKYRIGTIILHEKDGAYDIVDGQQRIISLLLLKYCLCSLLQKHNEEAKCEKVKIEESSLFQTKFANKTTQYNINRNYAFIKEFISGDKEMIEKFYQAFENILEAIVIYVLDESEAFQLFDSQNTRGKALDPHDLLKAYHLREMKNYPDEMKHAVTKWEANDAKDIRELFDLYLFPIWNWSRGFKSKKFTEKEINIYKGISENLKYTYAKRARKAAPHFQITEPFISGKDFFDMVERYIGMRNVIKTKIDSNKDFEKINNVLKGYTGTGFRHAENLFYCALLCYYDKFNNFDKTAVKKLFLWAFMLRVDMRSLGFDSVNNYAIGNEKAYTNTEPVFMKINLARKHEEISALRIEVKEAKSEKWNKLYEEIKEIR